ncbi:MAG: hypothetical protein Hals2KO_33100 [Halioglobus sp.]
MVNTVTLMIRAISLAAAVVLGTFHTCGFAAGPEPLLLTFGPGHVGAQRYSSKPQTSVQTVDGARVVLQRERGTEYRLQAGEKTWTWFQIEEVPASESYLAVTPTLDGDTVTLEIDYRDRQGDTSTSFASTLSGEVGSWIMLMTTGQPMQKSAAGSTRSYTAGSQTYSSADSLSVRVDRVR